MAINTIYHSCLIMHITSQCRVCPQIKRAFRTLRTRAHPDKGGDADEFHRLVTAYNVLSDKDKVRSKSIACGFSSRERHWLSSMQGTGA
jgi:curved DNA-binding protein CbpA